jgi:hypothetical protein
MTSVPNAAYGFLEQLVVTIGRLHLLGYFTIERECGFPRINGIAPSGMVPPWSDWSTTADEVRRRVG